MLWPDGETAKAPSASGDLRSRASGSKPMQPGGGYGAPSPPRVRETNRYPEPAAPWYDGYRRGGATPYGPVEPDLDPMERFSFRPLTERERARLEADRPSTYYSGPPAPAPSSQSYPDRYDQSDPSRYGQAPGYPERRGGGYGYRPPVPGGDSPDRWIEPYPSWSEGHDYRAPWESQPAPRWGSQPHDTAPPARRMYPLLNEYQDRRFTAR